MVALWQKKITTINETFIIVYVIEENKGLIWQSRVQWTHNSGQTTTLLLYTCKFHTKKQRKKEGSCWTLTNYY